MKNIHVNENLFRKYLLVVYNAGMRKTKISDILHQLMRKKNLHATELARQVNLPQPTIHRILTGACEHPHLSTIKPLANFFDISVEQLKGFEPISFIDNVLHIPLIHWDQITTFERNLSQKMAKKFIVTDAIVSIDAYAVEVNDASMEPVFPRGSILISDPKRQAKDRSYVLAKLQSYSDPVFRQLLIDADKYYLKPLSPDFSQYKLTQLSNHDKIYSTVVQVRRDYN